MKYDAYLTSRAEKQYERLDGHIRNKIRTELLEIEEEPYKKRWILRGLKSKLRYALQALAGGSADGKGFVRAFDISISFQ